MRWATDRSELQRVLQRLQDVDDAHDEAERHYIDCHRDVVLLRTFNTLCKRAMMPGGEHLMRFVQRAALHLQLHRIRVLRRKTDAAYGMLAAKTPMGRGKQLEVLCEHAGAAEAYQWVHLSGFR